LRHENSSSLVSKQPQPHDATVGVHGKADMGDRADIGELCAAIFVDVVQSASFWRESSGFQLRMPRLSASLKLPLWPGRFAPTISQLSGKLPL